MMINLLGAQVYYPDRESPADKGGPSLAGHAEYGNQIKTLKIGKLSTGQAEYEHI